MSRKSTTAKWTATGASRVNEVDVLEREAKEMEVQLKALQNRMQQQQLEDDAVVKTGGCRWKSARPDKGTVLSYAKDVQDKYRSKYGVGEDPVLRAPPETIRLAVPNTNVSKTTMLPQQNPSSFRQKDVATWAIHDVGEWLRSVNLETYAASFRINEISGQVLLDIGLDDLDYMGVTILAHRKLILKGIEDLRKNKRVTIQVRQSENVAVREQCAEVAAAPVAQKTGVAPDHQKTSPSVAPAVHWSHLEPLSSHEVSSSSSNRLMANAADDEGYPDVLDEAAEQEAFREAVASWRGEGGGRLKIVREWETKDEPIYDDNGGSTTNSKLSADEGMWHNPFAPPVDVGDAQAKGAVAPVVIDPCAGASLAEGALDEAAEHAEFIKAVEAWRNRDKPTERDSPKAAKAVESGSFASSSAKPSSSASAAALAMAAKIAQDMEAEQEQFASKARRERVAATQRLEEARRQGLKENTMKAAADIEFDCLSDDRNAHAGNFAEAKRPPLSSFAGAKGYDPRVGLVGDKSRSSPPSPAGDSKNRERGNLSPASCSHDDGVEANDSQMKTPRTLTVSLIESKLGYQNQNEGNYYVDEGDDDDD